MTTIHEIELPPEDLAAFRAWFAGFDADIWDKEFDRDVVAGRLEQFAGEALRDERAGRTTDL